ncbi:cytochrome P450 [Xylariaceae sp. FL0255]|nr:cytochrome P450 [Xylariaceae sp. FL0255]
MEAIRSYVPEGLTERLAGLPMSVQVIGVTILLSLIYGYITADRPHSAFPVISVNGKSPLWSWMLHGPEVVKEGLKRTTGPFQVITGTGPRIVLPNKYADEIRNSPELNFPKAFQKEFMVNYPGFEPHKHSLQTDYLIQDTVRIKLTQSLGLVTDDIVDETTFSLKTVLGQPKEWETRQIREDALEIVARVSSRVFLGADLCRNRRWLDITKTYTTDSFLLSRLMRFAPKILRPFVYLVLPQSFRLRASVRDAHKLIDPEVARRKAKVDAARAAGQKPPKTADTIGWMYDVAREGDKVNYVSGQLSLSMAAIHTTTESLGRALVDICAHPEVGQMLREEIIEVLGKDGWAKTTLYKLKIMDSFLKESQRYTPLSSNSMNRYVERELTLSDGTKIPAGSRIVVAGNYRDPEIFEEPDKYDATRFLKMRQRPGQENSWQFVTTSAAHQGFGHGQHACPGRFFASNEIKILLCHMLLKYDWRFVPGEDKPKPVRFEATAALDPKTRLQCRARTPELDLDNLVV